MLKCLFDYGVDRSLLDVVPLAQRACHQLLALLDHVAVMFGIHEAAGDDIRPAHQLAVFLIDGDDDNDDAVA